MAGLRHGTTYGELVTSSLRRHGSRTAFVGEGGSLTYAQAADRVGRMIGLLNRAGVRRGDGVAVLAANSPDAWLAWAATAVMGARFTALHPLGSLEDHLFMCHDGEIRVLVFDAPVFDERADQLVDGGSLEQAFALGPSQVAPDLVAVADAGPPAVLRPDVTEADPCVLLYTGGTTGRPKGVLHSHRSFAEMVVNALCDFQLPSEIRYLVASPVTHAATTMVVPTLLRGGTVHLHRGFDPERYLTAIERERITLCFGVPTMVYRLLDDPALGSADLSSVETFVYGASPMAPSRLVEAIDAFGPVFTQFYGQTESAATGTALWKEEHDPACHSRLLSCGKPVSGVRLRIEDPDGNEVGPGERGEICLQGRGVMDAYWNLPDATEEALRGGWLHTGDVGTRDDDGFVTIVDRMKDMIISGGYNVYPREVEDVLCSHPAVAAVAVIGVPDATWGEAVKALVVRRPGQDLDPAELVELVRRRKGPIHAPKSVDFVETIPLTPVGKADKKRLREPFWRGEERGVR